MKKYLLAALMLGAAMSAAGAHEYSRGWRSHDNWRGGYHEGYRGRDEWVAPFIGGALFGGALYGGYESYNRHRCYSEGAVDYRGYPIYDTYGEPVLTTRCY